jgi:hypothetical protein
MVILFYNGGKEMTDLDKLFAKEINKLWRKAFKEAEEEMPQAFTQSSVRVLHLQCQRPSLIVRRAWSRGDRYIYLYITSDEAELLSLKKKIRSKARCVEIDILPLIELDK